MRGESLLVFNALRRTAYLLEVLDFYVGQEGAKCIARVLWTNDEQVPSGYSEAKRLASKWYRVDAKLLLHVSPRYAMQRWAPIYEVAFSDVEKTVMATVSYGDFYINLALADFRLDKDKGLVRLQHLFSDDVELSRFLKGESVFYEQALAALSLLESETLKYAKRYAEVVERVGEVTASVVDRVPGSFELIAQVLRKYNVEPRDVVDYAVAEEAVRRLLEQLKQQQQAG